MTQLQLEFSKSELTDVQKDPEEWMTELEIIQSRLKSMSYEISEEQLMVHVLNNLPLLMRSREIWILNQKIMIIMK